MCVACISQRPVKAPPVGGVPVDVLYEPKNAKISVFLAQPQKSTLFLAQGGETTYLSEPDLLALTRYCFIFVIYCAKILH